MIQIITEKINIEAVIKSVEDPSAGGIDVFIGTTRNHSEGKEVLSLEYESYQPMALKKMNEITEEARRRWDVINISIVHRIGSVDFGEASVVIAVSSAHRKEAFEACRYAIDALKNDVPIWKKEVFNDGKAWVVSGKPSATSE